MFDQTTQVEMEWATGERDMGIGEEPETQEENEAREREEEIEAWELERDNNDLSDALVGAI